MGGGEFRVGVMTPSGEKLPPTSMPGVLVSRTGVPPFAEMR